MLTFLPAANVLKGMGQEAAFLVCDPYYQQQAGLSLSEKDIPYHELASSSVVSDWCSLSEEEQRPLLVDAHLLIAEQLLKLRPDTLVVGNDVGKLEQITLRAAERFGIRTVRIQDGIQTLTTPERRERTGIEPTMFPPIPFEGGCDALCVWTKKLADELLAKGIGGDVALTGSLRHDELVSWPGYTPHEKPYRALVAAQAFSKFGDMWPSQEVALYERIVSQLLSRGDTEVILRPHPESQMIAAYERIAARFPDRVTLDTSEDVLQVLKQVDLLVTVSSTVSAESAAMGIPTARLLHLRTVLPAGDFDKPDRQFEEVLRSAGFPNKVAFGLNKPLESFGERLLGSVDGRAKQRTVEACLRVHSAHDSDAPSAPVSVLTTSDGGDPVPTLRSILRNTGVEIELVLVDRSPHPGISEKLASLFEEANTTLLHLPQASAAEALKHGLAKCNNERVFRVECGTVLFPGFLSSAAKVLTEQPKCTIASSWFFGRNSLESFEGLVAVPEDLTLALMTQFGSYMMLSYAYGFRQKEVEKIGGFQSGETPDIDLISRLLSGSRESGEIGIVPSGLFLNPIAPEVPDWDSFQFHWDRFYSKWQGPRVYTSPHEVLERLLP